MLNGFNILICGSSPITETHIKVLKKIKICNIKYIFGEDINKINYLSKKFNIEICDSLLDKKIHNCNLAVITSSTHKHYNLILKLADKIKNIIVEKPLVSNLSELSDLISYNEKKKINLYEVSQNLFNPDIKNYEKKIKNLEIVVKKKRSPINYINHKNILEKSKSPIMAQLPHWYDISSYLINKNLFLDDIQKKKIIPTSPFNDYYRIKLASKDKSHQSLIYIDYSSNINLPTKLILDNEIIIFDDKKYLKIIKNLMKKLSYNKFSTFSEKNFFLMYTHFMNKIIKKENTKLTSYFEKIKILEELNKQI